MYLELKFWKRKYAYAKAKIIKPIRKIYMAKLIAKKNNSPKGKIGNLIFYKVQNKILIRCKPVFNKNKISQSQFYHRLRFSFLAEIYNIFKPIIRFNMKGYAINQPALFFNLNLHQVEVNGKQLEIDFNELIFTNHANKNLLGLNIDIQNEFVQFDWEADKIQFDNFSVMTAVYCNTSNKLILNEVNRNELSSKIITPILDSEKIPFIFSFRK